jgi:hypothetical protein
LPAGYSPVSFDEKLVVEIIGEFERLVFIARAGAAINLALGGRNLDSA